MELTDDQKKAAKRIRDTQRKSFGESFEMAAKLDPKAAKKLADEHDAELDKTREAMTFKLEPEATPKPASEKPA